jgi:hypothetical protein
MPATPSRYPRTIRPARVIAVSAAAVLVGVLALAVSAPSQAATPCWRQVINDWVKNDRVQTTYPLHCYKDALAHVPEDMRVYSSIEDDILAARQLAARRTLRTTQSVKPGSTTTPSSTETQQTPTKGLYKEAINQFQPRNADSMPLPLMILAGLALLLIAAGGAGLISRRLRARKIPG